MLEPTWKIATKAPSNKSKNWLSKVLSYNRGLNSPQKLADFLNPTLSQILAIKLTDSSKAVERILKAIDNKEKIIVYSDYDADGICATAIMWETLYDLGADVLPYVPHRIKEGYGLSTAAITELARKGAKLIVTVDHGVTANEQIEHAKKLGLDVIVTDHHVLPKKPPRALAIVHTVDLCGTGVAWRLCWDIAGKISPPYQDLLIEKLELAALATIADLVPLNGANRPIVKIGLAKMAQTKRPGIKALIKSTSITNAIGTYEIGHILAPRINAMGRIEHGLDSLRLLCAKSQQKADELAKLLSKTNTRRQDLTVRAVSHAVTLVDEEQLIGVVHDEKWHEGVIGLVASRLAESFHRPMVVISRGQTYSKGSARSVPGFNIVEAIRASSEYLVDAGGHPMAAGFTIETKLIESFTQKINSYARAHLRKEHLKPTLNIECELEVEDINRKNLEIIKMFEPYGVANPQPLFLTRNMLVEDVRSVGQDANHLKLQVEGFSAIGFNLGEKRALIRPGYLVDLVYTPSDNHYNNNQAIQLKIKDIAIHSD